MADFTSGIMNMLGRPNISPNQFDKIGGNIASIINGNQEEDERLTVQYTSALLNAAPEQRQAIVQKGLEVGAFDEEYAQEFSRPFEQIAPVLASYLQSTGNGNGKKSEGFTLGAGDTRYDANGNIIAQGSESKKSPKLEKIDTGDSIELVDSSTGETIRSIPKSGSSKELEKQIKAADRKFKQTNDLRAEVRKVDPAFIKVQDAFTNVEASAKDPSAAGDLALIFNYMKVLDPGSAVKEGEFATAASAGGVDERVFGLYNRIINGERLTDGQRADFLDRATRLYGANDKKFKKRTAGILKQANKFGIPLDEIGLGRFSADMGGDMEISGSQSGANITTQAQYDALPSGAIYTEDGKRYQKP
jgi:hypothetical protein